MRNAKPSSQPIAWAEASSWMPLVRDFLRSRLKAGAIRAWKNRSDLDDLYVDDSEWQAMLDSSLTRGLETTADALAEHLEQVEVKVFHGCKPVDVGEYLREGVATASWQRRARLLYDLIEEFSIPPEKAAALMRSLEEESSGRDVDTGVVFVALDQRHLVETCGHYLILGSEWAAGHLGQSYFEELRKRGITTMLHLRLPLSCTTDRDRREFADELLREWTRLTTLSETSVRNIDFTFRLNCSLPPELLFTHTHPQEIPDPHHPLGYGRAWKNPNTMCRHCR